MADTPGTSLEQIPDAPWRRLPDSPWVELRAGLDTVRDALIDPTRPQEQP